VAQRNKRARASTRPRLRSPRGGVGEAGVAERAAAEVALEGSRGVVRRAQNWAERSPCREETKV
jgi:hypothetical protein